MQIRNCHRNLTSQVDASIKFEKERTFDSLMKKSFLSAF